MKTAKNRHDFCRAVQKQGSKNRSVQKSVKISRAFIDKPARKGYNRNSNLRLYGGIHEQRNHSRKEAVDGRVPQKNGRILACGKLSCRGTALYAEESPSARASYARSGQKEDRRSLGHRARAELHLCPPQPRHQKVRPRSYPSLRSRSRRQLLRRQLLFGGDVQRSISQRLRGRSGHDETDF